MSGAGETMANPEDREVLRATLSGGVVQIEAAPADADGYPVAPWSPLLMIPATADRCDLGLHAPTWWTDARRAAVEALLNLLLPPARGGVEGGQ